MYCMELARYSRYLQNLTHKNAVLPARRGEGEIMSYVKIGSEGFIDIEEAVIYAEDSDLKSAVIDVYNDFGKFVESQAINSADNYKYYAYAIFEEVEDDGVNGPFWDWYNDREVFYNTVEECQRVLEFAHIGSYKIVAVYQDLSTYFNDRDIMCVEIVMHTKYLT